MLNRKRSGGKLIWPSIDKMDTLPIIDPRLPLSETPPWDYKQTNLIQNHTITFRIPALGNSEEVGIAKQVEGQSVSYKTISSVAGTIEFSVDLNELDEGSYKLFVKDKNKNYRFSSKTYETLPGVSIDDSQIRVMQGGTASFNVRTKASLSGWLFDGRTRYDCTLRKVSNGLLEASCSMEEVGKYIVIMELFSGTEYSLEIVFDNVVVYVDGYDDIPETVQPPWRNERAYGSVKTVTFNRVEGVEGSATALLCTSDLSRYPELTVVKDLGNIESATQTVSMSMDLKVGSYRFVLRYEEWATLISTQSYEMGLTLVIDGTVEISVGVGEIIQYEFLTNASTEASISDKQLALIEKTSGDEVQLHYTTGSKIVGDKTYYAILVNEVMNSDGSYNLQFDEVLFENVTVTVTPPLPVGFSIVPMVLSDKQRLRVSFFPKNCNNNSNVRLINISTANPETLELVQKYDGYSEYDYSNVNLPTDTLSPVTYYIEIKGKIFKQCPVSLIGATHDDISLSDKKIGSTFLSCIEFTKNVDKNANENENANVDGTNDESVQGWLLTVFNENFASKMFKFHSTSFDDTTIRFDDCEIREPRTFNFVLSSYTSENNLVNRALFQVCTNSISAGSVTYNDFGNTTHTNQEYDMYINFGNAQTGYYLGNFLMFNSEAGEFFEFDNVQLDNRSDIGYRKVKLKHYFYLSGTYYLVNLDTVYRTGTMQEPMVKVCSYEAYYSGATRLSMPVLSNEKYQSDGIPGAKTLVPYDSSSSFGEIYYYLKNSSTGFLPRSVYIESNSGDKLVLGFVKYVQETDEVLYKFVLSPLFNNSKTYQLVICDASEVETYRSSPHRIYDSGSMALNVNRRIKLENGADNVIISSESIFNISNFYMFGSMRGTYNVSTSGGMTIKLNYENYTNKCLVVYPLLIISPTNDVSNWEDNICVNIGKTEITSYRFDYVSPQQQCYCAGTFDDINASNYVSPGVYPREEEWRYFMNQVQLTAVQSSYSLLKKIYVKNDNGSRQRFPIYTSSGGTSNRTFVLGHISCVGKLTFSFADANGIELESVSVHCFAASIPQDKWALNNGFKFKIFWEKQSLIDLNYPDPVPDPSEVSTAVQLSLIKPSVRMDLSPVVDSVAHNDYYFECSIHFTASESEREFPAACVKFAMSSGLFGAFPCFSGDYLYNLLSD